MRRLDVVRVRRALLAAVAMAFWASSATAQSVSHLVFTPSVIPSTSGLPVLIEAEIIGAPTSVSVDFRPAGATPVTVPLRDNGSGGDKVAGDGTYSAQLPVAPILAARTADDVYRVFIGFLDLFNGATRVLRGNLFVDVYSGEIGTYPITPISPFVQASPRVVNIHDPLFFANHDPTRIAQEFYRWFGDDYDGLNIVSDPQYFANRFHMVVRNDVQGIGVAIFNQSSVYGSAGRLQGISRFPIARFFDGAETGFLHEFGHQWISYLSVPPLAAGVPHWPFSTMATGVMGFSIGGQGGQGGEFRCSIVESNGHIFLNPRPDAPAFNDLDLYLMGLLPAADVRSQFVFADQAAAAQLQCLGQEFTGPIERVDMDDIIAAFGPRVPAYGSAPRHFRLATILVTRDGLATPEMMWLYSRMTERAELQTRVPTHLGFSKQLGQPFYVATGGRGTLDTSLDFGLTVDAVTPSSGSGLSQVFSAHYSGNPGVADLQTVYLRFSVDTSGPANSCMVRYDRATGLVALRDNAGVWLPGVPLPGAGAQANSQCSLNVAASSVSIAGDTLTLNAAMSFSASYAGLKNIFLYAASEQGTVTGWQQRGTWTVPAPVIEAVSVSPNAGSGATQEFTLVYTDSFGVTSDLVSARVRFGATNVGPGTCTARFNAMTGAIELLNDAGAAWAAGTLGSGTLSNSQCTLNLASSSATPNGTSLTLVLNITFTPAFTGLKNIYMLAASSAGSNTGWVQRGTWTNPVVALPVVEAVSVTPSAATGMHQAFTLLYRDSLGASDLSARVRFGASNVAVGTCSFWFNASTGLIQVMNDAGIWGPGVPLGSGTLSNSICSLNLATSVATLNGNDLTLVLDVTFSCSFAGSKNIYMLAASLSTGENSGWQNRGIYTVSCAQPGVNPISVSPDAGTGASQTFTLLYSDSVGAADLSSARVRFATGSGQAAGTCSAWYDATTNLIKLMDDGGVWGSPVPLGSGTLSNGQCTMNLASSSATPSGTTLTLVLNITFNASFTGLKNVYMLAGSATGPNSSWIQRGTWTPYPSVGPAVVDVISVTPNAGVGAAQLFTLQYSDSLGAADLSSARVRFGAANVGPGTCTVWYDASNQTIKLMDDAGTWGSAVPMGSGTMSNTQCTVSLAASTATAVGDALTLVLHVTFSGTFSGIKNIYMLGGSAGGTNTGWVTRGTWTVPSALLRDDFNGSTLNDSHWFMPSGAGTFLGRTQLRPPSETLDVSNGVLRLRLDTYNPTAITPGDSFWGSEIVSHSLFTRGAGITFSTRARLVGPMPGGLVGSLFSYVTQSGLHDEIDVELLSNDIASPRALTNVFDNDDFSVPGHPAFVTIPGFVLTEFNLYEVDWLPDRVRWRINGMTVREDAANVPDEAMSIRLNLWAPASTFPAAFNAALQPAALPAANQTFFYDVDFVEVRNTP